ncbi:hypothetical protein NC652_015395 [Populus alba x Populus x berolinensis]|nr:hypothetical protein NC652_015395 [Populus alba x Populus x berolinensis]
MHLVKVGTWNPDGSPTKPVEAQENERETHKRPCTRMDEVSELLPRSHRKALQGRALEVLVQQLKGFVLFLCIMSSNLTVHACHPRGALHVHWVCRMFSEP